MKKDNKKLEELGYKAFYFMMKFVFVMAVITFCSILVINSMEEKMNVTFCNDTMTLDYKQNKSLDFQIEQVIMLEKAKCDLRVLNETLRAERQIYETILFVERSNN